ncbi:DNA cytosine methyltransferase [Salmonella enterica]|uniref:DNA cytosine methyltransferase n=1 Tax=Salmonella enterica subsp. enterica serovar Dessau TaxID=2564349 RepID=A0A8E5ILP9_SALET|nr:DNA cytosine methyltransferase [Salmonella enterica]EEK2367122.1 DNA cytosine methyltransferase [Salmonella enterica subsp. enterica serovar Senftenberg]EIB8069485.1 DNA cytosine methyltransferase [Salmonella enterica]EIB8083764.1 DNA cytosine methyltransferase [Salmonella enterica]MBC7053680.1 DNA cytosine methyltransferase [Salmonella enterica subsp. enterica serovar Dessau]QUS46575.1 DNA cytosine methyltransferase [Salmonella enterica subsp. enterica serovar Dessau]
MAAYYNEIDSYAAQWLRNLIAGGHIAPGEVDERSIEDVTPDDLRGFTQCHFFAGIGVWSHSLRLAGWPDDKPVWTGSCPCQPFSAAGKGDGFADERHLWPAFFHLISERRPQHVFGEQVASGNANTWFDLVQADLEGMGYAFGLVPFAAAGIGAPHIRERAYWVAHASSKYESTAGNETGIAARLRSRSTDRLANTGGERLNRIDSLLQREESGRVTKSVFEAAGHSVTGGMGYADHSRLERHIRDDSAAGRERAVGSVTASGLHSWPLEVNGFWRDADWLLCRDGQWRPVEPGTFPLVARFAKSLGHGKSSLRAMAGRNRTGRLKGYGNAINAQAAAAFIGAYMETANVPANSTGPDIR